MYRESATVRRVSQSLSRNPERDLLADLTEPQREAVTTTEGPLLVLAAAGSGKTRVITRRIAYLVGIGVPPWSICALTFTNKAAGEMRERAEHLLAGAGESSMRGLTVMTFHALCARLLRRHAEESGIAGLKPDFAIYDTSDQTAVVKRVIGDLGLTTKNWPVASVRAAISRAKNDLMDASAYTAGAGDFASKQVAKIYTAYETAMRRAGAIDFDDLLLLTARMLRENEQVRRACNQRWSYLMVDEYQDTNHAQFLIAGALAGEDNPNICVVGDPDQAIYSWRGADISNILEFEERYPNARTIALGENFRSTAPILAAADRLIKHNVERKDKPLFTSRAGGEKPTVVLCRDERHEGDVVADFLRLHAENGTPWKSMAVFYRTNALSRVIEDALRTSAIPYTIARGTAFYEREEVRHALAYLRVIANPADDVALGRIVNTPARGIGKTTLAAIEDRAAAERAPMLAMMRCAGEVSGLTARAVAAAERFASLIDSWTGAGTFMGASVAGTLHELVERVIKESGLEKHYDAQAKASGLASDEERLDNLSELVSSARAFEDEFDPTADPAAVFEIGDATQTVQADAPPLLAMLRAFLESVALVADADAVDPEQGAVTLMTLHAAKGLEFACAAMIGLETGMLPHSRAAESPSDMEEERRLAFVGITRAMQYLLMTSARYRTIRGVTERMIPSRFIEEIGADLVRLSDQTGGGYESGEQEWSSGAARREGFDQRPAAAPQTVSASGFKAGMLVRHPQFGLGEVLSVQGGANARAQIRFRQVGVKTLVLEYARLKRADG